jgi:sucrose-6-phosphatase
MKLIATDLDRTLLPNGKQEYDNSMNIFKKIIKKRKFKISYITGRNLNQTKDAIKKYKIPNPDYLISSVGTKIYQYNHKNKRFSEDKKWAKIIKKETPQWNTNKIKKLLIKTDGLKLQEKENQNQFKISFYADTRKEKKILKEVRKKIKKIKRIKTIYSHDYPIKRGLLDIMPSCSTKKGALDYITKKSKIKKKDTIFCGDSGNDLNLLISEYKSIIVRNANSKIKKEVKAKKGTKKLYIAKKQKELNGNYVSGIIQGLIHFNLISKKELKNSFIIHH